MSSIKTVIETIQTTIDSLEATIADRKNQIEKSYRDAIKQAENEKKLALKEFTKTQNEIDTLRETLGNLSGSKKGANISRTVRPAKPLDIPKEYDSGLKTKAKVAYVLANANKGLTREEVANEIAKLDEIDKEDVSKIKANVAGVIGSLKKAQLLDYTTNGRIEVYSFKNK